MAFSKFKFEPNRTNTPVPIAAAIARPSSTNGQVQHESQGASFQGFSSDRIHAHFAGHTGHAGPTCVQGGRDLLAPIVDQRSRCSKRQSPSIRKQVTCFECKISQTRCEKPLTGPKDKCLQCLRQNKECSLLQSLRLPGIEQFALQPAPLSPSRPPQALQTQFMTTPPFSNDRKKRKLEIDSSPETDSSAFFLQGSNQPSPSFDPSTGTRRHQLDCKVDSFFSRKVAEQVFHRYIDEFAPKCPFVVFPPGTTAESARKTQPLLFLSILSIASAGYCTVDQQRQLAREAKNFLVESAIMKGEKSLELIQALQVVSLWYRAPDKYTQMNQTQLASVALTMAIDLGMDRIEVSKPSDRLPHTWGRTEAQRSWLGCFFLCSSLSLILRRPNLTTWSSKLDEYLDDLQQTKASPTDAFLCELITAECLCHDANQQLFLSDPDRSISLWDPKTMTIIKYFQSRIDCPPLGQLNSLERSLVEFSRFGSSLYVHELALHVNHNIDEFKAPFLAKSLESCHFVEAQAPSASHLLMLRAIILAAQELLDTFIRLSISNMLALPPHIYGGRVIYAVIILMKLSRAITASMSGWNGFIHVDQLRLETYIEQLVLISKRLIMADERNSLSRAFLIMPQLKEWFYAHASKTAFGSDKDTPHGGLRTKHDHGPLVSAAETKRGSLNGPSAETQIPFHMTPDCSAQSGSTENEFEPSRCEYASDSWFWEFFNVDMLH